jgi:alpha-D-ribose 1-methylphosphonate 5-phosphate C-P lyase
MDKKCAICGKKNDLFELVLLADNGEQFSRFVCGSCWEIIATIAIKATKSLLYRVGISQ